MRTSKDQYKTQSGELVEVSQDQQPPEGAKIWNGYDYKNQCWMRNGAADTRTVEELRANIEAETREQAKQYAMSDIGLTEDEAELAVYEFGSFTE